MARAVRHRLAPPGRPGALAAAALLACGACGAGAPPAADAFMKGADVSLLDEYQQRGYAFSTEGGTEADLLDLLAAHGVGWIRLRVWNDPAGGWCGPQRTLAMARRVQAKGLHLLLDLHYSDTWADPGHQQKPAAWAGLGGAALRDAVYAWTRDTVAALAAQGTPPEVVQLGNEITQGLLWDDGRVGGAFDTPAQWQALGALLSAGARGVREAAPGARIMLHLDRGGDHAGARWWFDGAVAQGVDFDLVGLSYYPWWHGTVEALTANLRDLGARYGKDVVVVETSYPWTLADHGGAGNFVTGAGQLLPAYPATPGGQRAYLADLVAAVRAEPRGAGVFWWAPEFVYAPDLSQSSPSDNLTLFDDQRRALEGIRGFE